MGKIKVVLDPQQRGNYIDMLLKLDGLTHIKEDPKAAYCPISLTSTPDELKSYLKRRQELLKQYVLKPAGIIGYDPGTSPFSPDTNLTSQPNEVYVVDSGKIAGARYFVGHKIIPSDGQGIESEKAKTLNRVSVVLIDKSIRVSRMQPHRTIYLQYENFEMEKENFVPVFEMLREFEPGMGFNDDIPVLLGFRNEKIVDLEEEVYREFPHLQYHYDGTVPIVRFRAENPEIFYEHR